MPLHGARRDNYSLSDSHIFNEKCIQLGLEAAYQKVNSSPQLCVPTKGSISGSRGSVGPLCVFLLFCLGVFNIALTRRWPDALFSQS